MRILFLSSELFNKTGAGMNTRSYLKICQTFAGDDSVVPFAFPKRGVLQEKMFKGILTEKKYTKIEKIFNVIFRGDPLIGKDVEQVLIRTIKDKNIDVVFMFRSIQSTLLKVIKKEFPYLPVVAFYHDIYPDVYALKKKNYLDFMIKFPIYHKYLVGERYCSKYADANVVLNQRDRMKFEHYYRKKVDLVSPVVCEDNFNYLHVKRKNSGKMILCFIGSYFPPNINGIKWFVKNVFNHLSDVELWIVGNKMEKLNNDMVFLSDNIKIWGTVDDLGPYYYDSDVIIAPIFEGTGMKTKTAEALMYGKEYLATSEALEGYENSGIKPCNTAEEFIVRIESLARHKPEKFNSSIREVYLRNYSIKSCALKMNILFEKILEREKI